MSPFNFDSQSVGLVERIWNKIGAPSVMLAVMVLFAAGYFPSPITRMEAAIAAHQTDTARQLHESRKQTRLMFEVCMSQAKPERCGAALFDPDRVDAPKAALGPSAPHP